MELTLDSWVAGLFSKSVITDSFDDLSPFVYPAPKDDLVSLGRGYNSLTGRLRGNALIELPKSPDIGKPGTEPGQTVEYSLYQVEDFRGLRTHLRITASAAFQALGSSVGGVYQYARDSELHQYSNFLLVQVEVLNAASGLKEFALRDDVVAELKQGLSPEGFFLKYGDEVVIGTNTGGHFIALVEFRSESADEHESVRQTLTANSGTFKAQLDFESRVASVTKHTVTSGKVFRRGGVGPIPEIKDFAKSALVFPTQVDPYRAVDPMRPDEKGRPELFSFRTLDYAAVQNWPLSVTPPSLRKQRRLLANLGVQHDYALLLRNDISFVEKYSRHFGNPDITILRRKKETLARIIQTIGDTAGDLLEQPFKDVKLPELPFGDVLPLPQLVGPAELAVEVTVNVSYTGPLSFTSRQWAGLREGLHYLEALGIRLVDPPPGVGLVYTASFVHNGREETFSGRDGKVITPGVPTTDFIGLKSFSIDLDGPRAGSYDVFYQASSTDFISVGSYKGTKGRYESDVIGGGQLLDTKRIVQAVRVWILRRTK